MTKRLVLALVIVAATLTGCQTPSQRCAAEGGEYKHIGTMIVSQRVGKITTTRPHPIYRCVK